MPDLTLINNGGGEKKPSRELNIELMRIVSMLLVLLVHATFFSNSAPTHDDFASSPVRSFIFSYTEAVALVCVNCFILISGYFSIRPKLTSLCNLIFIFFFYNILIFIIDCGINGFSRINLFYALNPLSNWFVDAYLGLYLFAPVLNAFIDNASERTFRTFLLIYLATQVTLGWILPYPIVINAFIDFKSGYSVYAFIGLYCLARYIKLYGEQKFRGIINRRASLFLALFLSLAFVNTALFALAQFSPDAIRGITTQMFTPYTNLFTMAASVSLLLFFIKIRIPECSRFAGPILAFGKSAFAVFIIHINFSVVVYYKLAARTIYTDLPVWLWLPAVLIFIIAFYTCCVGIDRLRLKIWKPIAEAIGRYTADKKRE